MKYAKYEHSRGRFTGRRQRILSIFARTIFGSVAVGVVSPARVNVRTPRARYGLDYVDRSGCVRHYEVRLGWIAFGFKSRREAARATK